MKNVPDYRDDLADGRTVAGRQFRADIAGLIGFAGGIAALTPTKMLIVDLAARCRGAIDTLGNIADPTPADMQLLGMLAEAVPIFVTMLAMP